MTNKIEFYRFQRSKNRFDEATANKQYLDLRTKKEELNYQKKKLEEMKSTSWKLTSVEEKLISDFYLLFDKTILEELTLFENNLLPSDKFLLGNISSGFAFEHSKSIKLKSNYSHSIIGDIRVYLEFDQIEQKVINDNPSNQDGYSGQVVHPLEIRKQMKEIITKVHEKISPDNNINAIIKLSDINEKFKQVETIKENINLIEEDLATLKKNPLHERIEIEDISLINEKIENMNAKGWTIKGIEGIQSGNHFLQEGKPSYGGAGFGYGFTEGILIVWEKE